MCVEEAVLRISRPMAKGRRVRAKTKWQSLPDFFPLSSLLQSSRFKSSITRTVQPPNPLHIAVNYPGEIVSVQFT